jgi:hypothetical protein
VVAALLPSLNPHVVLFDGLPYLLLLEAFHFLPPATVNARGDTEEVKGRENHHELHFDDEPLIFALGVG